MHVHQVIGTQRAAIESFFLLLRRKFGEDFGHLALLTTAATNPWVLQEGQKNGEEQRSSLDPGC